MIPYITSAHFPLLIDDRLTDGPTKMVTYRAEKSYKNVATSNSNSNLSVQSSDWLACLSRDFVSLLIWLIQTNKRVIFTIGVFLTVSVFSIKHIYLFTADILFDCSSV